MSAWNKKLEFYYNKWYAKKSCKIKHGVTGKLDYFCIWFLKEGLEALLTLLSLLSCSVVS